MFAIYRLTKQKSWAKISRIGCRRLDANAMVLYGQQKLQIGTDQDKTWHDHTLKTISYIYTLQAQGQQSADCDESW